MMNAESLEASAPSSGLISDGDTVLKLPVRAPQAQAETSPLIERLVTQFGATWVDESNIVDWSAQGGDCVVLFAGDPVQFPEGLDVAVVLPELQRSFPGRFRVGVVKRQDEQALARRYGSQRWPTLMFLRDAHYVTVVCGMRDWEPFLEAVAQALEMPLSRAPTIGIPVVSANASGAATASNSACH